MNTSLFSKIVIEAIADSNVEHIQQAMQTMGNNLDTQDNPKVGIFWYDIKTKSLFGVIAIDKDSIAKPNAGGGLITCSELHKNVWKKNYHKQLHKYNGVGPFIGDYKDTPRGRIFYNPQTNQFIINVGSWINQHNEAIDEIIYEYDLYNQNVKVEIAPHWEIGCGWENE